jgi:hypothetical protein
LERVADELLKEATPVFDQMQKLSADMAKHKQSMAEQLSQYQKLITDPNR